MTFKSGLEELDCWYKFLYSVICFTQSTCHSIQGGGWESQWKLLQKSGFFWRRCPEALPDTRVFFLLNYFSILLHQKKTEVDRSLHDGDQFAETWWLRQNPAPVSSCGQYQTTVGVSKFEWNHTVTRTWKRVRGSYSTVSKYSLVPRNCRISAPSDNWWWR